jgi:hypothetical protein
VARFLEKIRLSDILEKEEAIALCQVAREGGLFASVALLNFPSGSCGKGLVPSLGSMGRKESLLEVGPRGKNFSHWQCALEGDIGTSAPSCLTVCFLAAMKLIGFLGHSLPP